MTWNDFCWKIPFVVIGHLTAIVVTGNDVRRQPDEQSVREAMKSLPGAR